VIIPGGYKMDRTRWIPKLKITMGNYTLTDDFFVVDVPDTNVVLGVQWLYSVGKYTIDQMTWRWSPWDQMEKRWFYGLCTSIRPRSCDLTVWRQ